MKEYIKDYIKEIDKYINENSIIKQEYIDLHLIKISFFSSERLIHLLVTLIYAVMTIFGFLSFVIFEKIVLLFIPCILVLFLIPYILHYFLLENSVQYMYKQYDMMLGRKNDKTK